MNKIYRKWQPEDIEFIEKNLGRFAMIMLIINIFVEVNTGKGILCFLQRTVN